MTTKDGLPSTEDLDAVALEDAVRRATAASSGRSGFWLKEAHVLRLTACELGWLLAVILGHGNDVECYRPSPGGSPRATTMRTELLRKIDLAMKPIAKGDS